MTDFSDFDQFAQEVQDKVTDLWNDAQDALGTMARILNDAADAFDWKDIVFGPIGSAIIDGLTSDDVERAIDKFNNEIRPGVEDKLNELGGDVERVVSSMAGDPVGLKQLSFDYADCKAALLTPAPSIASEITALGHHWTGNAFDNYSVVATEQVQAMEDIAAGPRGGLRHDQPGRPEDPAAVGRPRRRVRGDRSGRHRHPGRRHQRREASSASRSRSSSTRSARSSPRSSGSPRSSRTT